MRYRPLLATALTLCAVAVQAADPSGWTRPACRTISGAPSVTATIDEGATLAKTRGTMAPISYTFGLTPLDLPDTLLATVGAQVLRSTDGGCRWQPLADLSRQTGNALLTLTPAAGGRAYAWAVNGNAFAGVEGEQVKATRVPGGGMMGLVVDRADPMRLRYGDSAGTVWTSTDGGRRWTATAALGGQFVYRAGFDPADPDHLVMGTLGQGAFTSFDGGVTWQHAAGFVAGKTPVNVFNVVVSPVDGRVVWAMGLDIAEADSGAPSGGRHLYLSTDGGLNFTRVVDQDDRVTLINGPLMVPHPADPGVLYFVFGMSFANYGTDLYRYDARRNEVTLTHSRYDEIGAIAFHPADPRLMYLGLVSENE